MHRRDLESLLDPRLCVVTAVLCPSTWRAKQSCRHRNSGTGHSHTQCFQLSSSCHLLFLSSSLRRPETWRNFLGGPRMIWRECCRVFCASTLPESSQPLLHA